MLHLAFKIWLAFDLRKQSQVAWRLTTKTKSAKIAEILGRSSRTPLTQI